jgi:phosphoesterase RecJ-like protein
MRAGGFAVQVMNGQQQELQPIQQAYELLTKSKNVLIVLPQHPSTDAIASGLAIYLMLQKLETNVKVVAANFALPTSHQFLPKSKEIESNLRQLRKFVITVDIAKTPVEELSYDINGDSLQIYLTPKKGFFREEDVKTSPGDYAYDLVVALDAPNLPSFGEVFEHNAEFFYQTPIINIDHHAANEQFGQINIVDIVATSVSEIVFELLKEFGHNILDEHIATNLLAGIISKTKTFRSLYATPRSLNIASHLIAQGARRDDIINNLYRTKSLSVIQLWGRALARLKTVGDGVVVFSKLNKNDFERSQADENDLPGILDEIMVNAEGAEIAFLCYERGEGTIGILMASIKSHDGLAVLAPLHPKGNSNLTHAEVVGDITAVEQQVLDLVEIYLEQTH